MPVLPVSVGGATTREAVGIVADFGSVRRRSPAQRVGRPRRLLVFLTQGIGLRPQPWAPFSGPVGPERTTRSEAKSKLALREAVGGGRDQEIQRELVLAISGGRAASGLH